MAVTELVGRTTELARARELLLGPSTRLLTLTGPGGTGKTSLALALAEAVRDDFADGVCFVDLSTVPSGEANLIWLAIGEALHLPELAAPPVLALHEHLAGRDLLLILDTCEHVLEAAVPLGQLLDACPGLKVLATSREPLHLRRERILDVLPLALPDLEHVTTENLVVAPAVALFVDRARAANPAFAHDPSSLRAIAELCIRLGGLPLAIELAAARCRLVPPQAVLERLRSQPARLSSTNRDAPERHRTLWSTMTWSYDLLDERSQAIFRHLGLFAGSFDADAVAAVCATDGQDDDVLEWLVLLADKSLLRTERQPNGEMRFRLLDTVREFALAQLRGCGEYDAAAARYARHYLDFAVRAGRELPGPNEAHWLDRLDLEYPNLRRAVRWAARSDAFEHALRACVAAGLFCRLRGHAHEALEWLEYALPRTEHVYPELRAQALELAAWLGWASGDRELAQRRLRGSIALWRSQPDPRGLAHALIELGMQEADRGHADEARTALEESLALARASGDLPAIAQALQSLGFRAEERGELDLAALLLEEAVTLRESFGHASELARSLNGLGIVARAQGALERSDALHARSLALYRALGHDLGAAYSLAYLGRAVARADDVRHAAALARESLGLAWAQRNPWAMAEAIDLLGMLAAQHELFEVATRLLERVEHLLGGTQPASSVARAEHQAALAVAREVLGASFSATWAAGQAMPLADVVQLGLSVASALEEPGPGDGEVDVDEVPQAPGVPLSPRELEVAVLVADGLTNRDIAERLVISKWTADNHVANILRKLSLARRAQVATWLAEQPDTSMSPSR